MSSKYIFLVLNHFSFLMLNYKACVCQQENVPCFSEGCRDAVQRSSELLQEGGGGGVLPTEAPALEWRLVHGQHIASAITGPTPSSPIISEKVQDKEGPFY